MYRLILSDGGFTYDDVFNKMTLNEIEEANAALDIYEEQLKKSRK